MPSSNPAFGRASAAPATASSTPAGAPQYGAPQYGAPAPHDPYAAPSPYAATTTRYMTMDDVVTKTGLSFLVTVARGRRWSGRCPVRPPGAWRSRPSSWRSCSAW